jgi:hypothetical protein
MTLFSSNAADRDTKLSSSVATRNFGVSVTILGAATTECMLVWWDLSVIPAGSIVNSATLKLYQAGSAAANAFTLTAFDILVGNSGWIEGTKNNATAGAGEPCWNYKAYNTVAWAGSVGLGTSGTDYNAANIGTDTGNRSDPNGTEYAIALAPAAVAAWLGNAANYGIKVITSTGCGAIASAENATAARRPLLEIDWTAAGGAAKSWYYYAQQ